jgi:cytoskeleton protein RodZ
VTESGNSETEQVSEKEPIAFGERLHAARVSQGFTITEIAKAIHLSENIIDAIERSDVERLPQPTFVQGYLRTYAKHLRLAEEHILEDYSKAVPHTLETELHPRSRVPDEASSASPFVKSVTIVLGILMLMAAIYGSYNYYSVIVDSRQDADETSELLLQEPDDPVDEMNIRPEIFGEETAEPLSSETEADAQVMPADELSQGDIPEDKPVELPAVSQPAEEEPVEMVVPVKPEVAVKTRPEAPGDDVVELIASEDTWAEVVDANDVGLLYDLVAQGRTVVLRGTAPFDIFLGNAPAMEVSVNGIKIDMTKFVRSNKIAHFNVSTSDQQVVFH